MMIILCCSQNVFSEDISFNWSLGDFAICYNIIDTEWNARLGIFKFNWFDEENCFGLGFNIINFQSFSDDSAGGSILPIEIVYRPIEYIYLYNRIEWQFMDGYKYGFFYDTLGIKFANYFLTTILNYAFHFSIFTEYTTRNELKVGLTLDSGFLMYLFASSYTEEKMEQNRLKKR
ncbi:MAG: hypothetical protein LBK13_07030 [Spirochaetales bacterium]|jgi:hypothetical protein|nr:hypothetical protein [Spirochaetales bacterium]